jgi:hypothetical protein
MCRIKQTSYQNKPGRGEREGKCAICRRETLVVWDHDHATGAYRGWLCRRCNLVLGYVKDDSLILRMAAYYLDHDGGSDAV